MIRPRRSAVLLAVPLVLAACSGGNGSAASSTTTTSPTSTTLPPTTTSTTIPADPFAVPDTITVDYLNRVMAALNKAQGDAFREIVQKGNLTDHSLAVMRATASGTSYRTAVNSLTNAVLDHFKGARIPPGDLVTTATAVTTTQPNCVAFDATDNASAVADHEVVVQSSYVLLRRQGTGDAVLNPTPWTIDFDGARVAGDLCSKHP